MKEIVIPAVTLKGITVLPGTIIHFDINRPKSIVAVERAMSDNQRLFLVGQKEEDSSDSGTATLNSIGTVAIIRQVTKLPGKVARILVEGLGRAQLLAIATDTTDHLAAAILEIDEYNDLEGVTEEAMLRHVRELLEQYCSFSPRFGQNSSFERTSHINRLGDYIDRIAMNIPIGNENKQKILEALSIRKRYEIFSDILINEIEILQVKGELATKIKEKVDKNQRDYLLREQMHVIREELGDNDALSDADQYAKDLEELEADQEVKDKIKKEINRFRSLSASSSESAVERAYIETVLELPWNKTSEDNKDLDHAEYILARDHYGLVDVKERIIEFLAVRQLAAESGKSESPVICLVGPPGTGKTSVARSIAEALGRKYVRISLGGVRDEAEIRGHRKTYVGAMPGRIATGLRQAGVANPLLLLDEIDKVSNDYKGDTFSALLEVLDSEQNVRFRDHYLEIPLDLSPVLFICTANTTTPIPRPLLDRMELIEVNSYTANEKYHIAKEHLVAKQFAKNGITRDMLSLDDETLRIIISGYTKEAGVRELERKIRQICRKAVRQMLKEHQDHSKVQGSEAREGETLPDLMEAPIAAQVGKTYQPIAITAANLEEYLKKPRYTQDKAREQSEVGIVRGLAWTSVGGDTLEIEVNVMPGKGDVDLTGQMGDVMKESARAAMSYVRSVAGRYKLAEELFQKNDFHIHIPEGAVPKDGPSAGITMACALLSAVTDIPVRSDVAMTGEVTLRGRVLPIGGLKEKLLAAKMADIKTVIVPQENTKDIREMDAEITDGLEIVYVEAMEEVLAIALVKQM
ncbi:MAG: endopeptidase La [Lachnospiraceae bacterium]|jgi:ATP-dependent Lon protease|nr:endopeptidase La [Lachnospiraceae bacterium]